MSLPVKWLEQQLNLLHGNLGVYVKDLQTCETFEHNADLPVVAASVIKIPVMIEFFRQVEAGILSPEEIYVLKNEDRLPSCGTLKCMHEGIQMNLLDLVKLMIVVSDNAATNIMIRRLGMENINATIQKLGCRLTVLRRLLFDSEASARGIENTITAGEIGNLLMQMQEGTLISEKASKNMLEILTDQRLNGKIPFFLHSEGIAAAHKTGEDDGITHDVGIVYAAHPVLMCFVSEKTDVPVYERFIQDAAWKIVSELEA